MTTTTAKANGKTPTAAAPQAEDSTSVTTIPRLDLVTLRVPIVGTAPLIMHRWSAKAKRQMLDAQQGHRAVREPRDPNADFLATIYKTEDGGYGFPVLAFKAATIGAARYYRTAKMTELRQYLFFRADALSDDGADQLTTINLTGDPVMREDMVRVGQTTDLRYRAEFRDWSATLTVVYVASSIDQSSVLSLVDAGGLGVGIGEWRPEKRGQNGTYQVDESRPVEQIRNS